LGLREHPRGAIQNSRFKIQEQEIQERETQNSRAGDSKFKKALRLGLPQNAGWRRRPPFGVCDPQGRFFRPGGVKKGESKNEG
jgi:hypothetical protein